MIVSDVYYVIKTHQSRPLYVLEYWYSMSVDIAVHRARVGLYNNTGKVDTVLILCVLSNLS